MERRDFFERTALSALAVLAGACADIGSVTGPDLKAEVTVTLADYPALGLAGGAARIAGVSPPLAVVNEGGGVYRAFSLVCPHAGTTVQLSGSQFVCPNHGARFDLNGTWTGGQRTSNLREYPTTYDEATGTVHVLPG